ncbi:MAG: recombinase family protein [Lachnospiraceae bacterium]|nr:recombinase family protein [Lachnospiraceae bacterium]
MLRLHGDRVGNGVCCGDGNIAFDYAIAGHKCSEIARILNEEGVLTPGMYYRMTHLEHKRYKNQSSLGAWTYGTIRNILRQSRSTEGCQGS